ncbi:MAG: hypothetical protein HY318_07855 [Armatimonadetes bacterium]|nr:hypothetical protein [Armatimonadota bacterium]
MDDSRWLEYGAFHESSHFFQHKNYLDFDGRCFERIGNFKSFRQTLWDLAVDRILLQFPSEWVAGGEVMVSHNPNPVPDFIRGKVCEVRKHYYERPNPDKVTDFDYFFHFLLWYSVNVALKGLCDYNPPQDQWTFATEALQSWHARDAIDRESYSELCDALLKGFYVLRGDCTS